MALWSFGVNAWTPVAVADATNFTDNGYQGLMGGSSTQQLKVSEVSLSGQEPSTSKPTFCVVARDSTVQATPTALTTGQSNSALHPATAALAAPQVAFTASTTKPQRSATLQFLKMSINAYGGIYRWQAGIGAEIWVLGNAASFGELSLSAYTGGTPGPIGSHIIYEPL